MMILGTGIGWAVPVLFCILYGMVAVVDEKL